MSGLASPSCVRNLAMFAYSPDRPRMRAAHLMHLAEGLAQTTALESFFFGSEEIDTSENQDTPLEDISGVLVDGIVRNNTIRDRSLESCNLTDGNLFPRLMKALQQHPKEQLKSLKLSIGNITTDHLKEFASYLGHEKCSVHISELAEFPISKIHRWKPSVCGM